MNNQERLTKYMPEEALHTSFSLTDIIQSQLPTHQKTEEIETQYGRKLPNDYDYIRLWEALMHPENPCPISAEQRQIIVDKYIRFDNMENDGVGQKAAHVTYVKFLCPKTILPALCAIHQNALEKNDAVNLRHTSMALILFNQALDVLQPPDSDMVKTKKLNKLKLNAAMRHNTDGFVYPYPPDHPLSERFAKIRRRAGDGSSNDLNTLQVLMYLAKRTTAEVISANITRQDINLNPAIPIPPQIEPGNFSALATLTLNEYLEAEQGVTFPSLLSKEIQNSNSVWLSVDFNSVMNVDETWANTLLLAQVIEHINHLSIVFQRTFKDTKQLYVVLNTGRPMAFAWGVLQTLCPIKNLHTLGVGEGGRVLLTDIIRGTTEITIENPSSWRSELDTLQRHLLSKIKDPAEDIIEDKRTVLSISLAKPGTADTTDAKWYYRDKANQPVNPEWIRKETNSFLTEQTEAITSKLKEMETNLEQLPSLHGKVVAFIQSQANGPDNIPGTLDDFDNITFELLQAELDVTEATWISTQRRLSKQLKTIKLMQEVLKGKYNPTAGYIDIGDNISNKYSAMVFAMRKKGIDPNQAVVIHIDDSNAGLLTETQSGLGEPNENVENVMLVGVNNSKGDFLEQVKKRAEKNRGLLTYGDATLGLLAVINGLTKLINDLPSL